MQQMASLEGRKPLVSKHHGDGPGSIGRLINPISHRRIQDAQNEDSESFLLPNAGHHQSGRSSCRLYIAMTRFRRPPVVSRCSICSLCGAKRPDFFLPCSFISSRRVDRFPDFTFSSFLSKHYRSISKFQMKTLFLFHLYVLLTYDKPAFLF